MLCSKPDEAADDQMAAAVTDDQSHSEKSVDPKPPVNLNGQSQAWDPQTPTGANEPTTGQCDTEEESGQTANSLLAVDPAESRLLAGPDPQERPPSAGEKCFYASFKIYLSPPEGELHGESGTEGQLGQEVVRIEKTVEYVDESSEDEEEPTLSLSSGDHKNLLEAVKCTPTSPVPVQSVDTEPSLSEALPTNKDESIEDCGEGRAFRSLQRKGGIGASPSNLARDGSPVFFLDPKDWVRAQGSVPAIGCYAASKLIELQPQASRLAELEEESLSAEVMSLLSPMTGSAVVRNTFSPRDCDSHEMSNRAASRSASSTPVHCWSRPNTPHKFLMRPIRSEQEMMEGKRGRRNTLPVVCYRTALLADTVNLSESLGSLSCSRKSLDVDNKLTSNQINKSGSLRSLVAGPSRFVGEDIKRAQHADRQSG